MTHDVPYSLREEIANAITHGLGAVLSVGAGAVLITLAVLWGDVWTIVGVSVFVGSLVLLYTASTLYHAIPHLGAKMHLQKFDHCAIYVLIAGTYTPFLLGAMRGGPGWILFVTIWALAAGGVVFKLFFTGRFNLVSTLLYIAMGWLIIFMIGPMRASLPPVSVAWLIAGGVAYTGGTVFYLSERMPYAHAIWHVFVLAGSVCHFAAVLTDVMHAA